MAECRELKNSKHKYRLLLTEREARYISDLLQNPLVDDEPIWDYRIRGAIFSALNNGFLPDDQIPF